MITIENKKVHDFEVPYISLPIEITVLKHPFFLSSSFERENVA